MGTRLYGIGTAINPDNVSEKISLEGLDTTGLNLLRDEHADNTFFTKIGGITYHKKIFKPEDCENEKQARCWQHAEVPFLYVEAELADSENHPDALSAAALIKFSNRFPQGPQVGFSVDGSIVQRLDANGKPTEDKELGKIISKAKATGIAMTVNPCNPKCKTWLENDLTKSDLNMPPPKAYLDAIKRGPAKTSINEHNDLKLFVKLEKLKKSLDNYVDGITDMRCNRCGKGIRFFKSGIVPNRCQHCEKSFSLTDIWQSLQK